MHNQGRGDECPRCGGMGIINFDTGQACPECNALTQSTPDAHQWDWAIPLAIMMLLALAFFLFRYLMG